MTLDLRSAIDRSTAKSIRRREFRTLTSKTFCMHSRRPRVRSVGWGRLIEVPLRSVASRSTSGPTVPVLRFANVVTSKPVWAKTRTVRYDLERARSWLSPRRPWFRTTALPCRESSMAASLLCKAALRRSVWKWIPAPCWSSMLIRPTGSSHAN